MLVKAIIKGNIIINGETETIRVGGICGECIGECESLSTNLSNIYAINNQYNIIGGIYSRNSR